MNIEPYIENIVTKDRTYVEQGQCSLCNRGTLVQTEAQNSGQREGRVIVLSSRTLMEKNPGFSIYFYVTGNRKEVFCSFYEGLVNAA